MFQINLSSLKVAAAVICLGTVPLVAQSGSADQKSASVDQKGILPITTKSAPARQLFTGALVKLQNLHGPEAMQDFHKAIQLDPDFALAYIMISFESVDPS